MCLVEKEGEREKEIQRERERCNVKCVMFCFSYKAIIFMSGCHSNFQISKKLEKGNLLLTLNCQFKICFCGVLFGFK